MLAPEELSRACVLVMADAIAGEGKAGASAAAKVGRVREAGMPAPLSFEGTVDRMAELERGTEGKDTAA